MHVFLDNPDADEVTPRTPEQHYAGYLTVFAHGDCWGDVGHCDIPEPVSAFGRRPPHPLIPFNATLEITDPLNALPEGTPERSWPGSPRIRGFRSGKGRDASGGVASGRGPASAPARRRYLVPQRCLRTAPVPPGWSLFGRVWARGSRLCTIDPLALPYAQKLPDICSISTGQRVQCDLRAQ
jgi:hypothetical protein